MTDFLSRVLDTVQFFSLFVAMLISYTTIHLSLPVVPTKQIYVSAACRVKDSMWIQLKPLRVDSRDCKALKRYCLCGIPCFMKSRFSLHRVVPYWDKRRIPWLFVTRPRPCDSFVSASKRRLRLLFQDATETNVSCISRPYSALMITSPMTFSKFIRHAHCKNNYPSCNGLYNHWF